MGTRGFCAGAPQAQSCTPGMCIQLFTAVPIRRGLEAARKDGQGWRGLVKWQVFPAPALSRLDHNLTRHDLHLRIGAAGQVYNPGRATPAPARGRRTRPRPHHLPHPMITMSCRRTQPHQPHQPTPLRLASVSLDKLQRAAADIHCPIHSPIQRSRAPAIGSLIAVARPATPPAAPSDSGSEPWASSRCRC